MKKNKISTYWYVVVDIVAAVASWCLFYVLRKKLLGEPTAGWQHDDNLLTGSIAIVIFWIGLFFMTGHYTSLYHKSRIQEWLRLMITSAIGCVIIFFVLLTDDATNHYSYFTKAFLLLYALHFFCTIIPRQILLQLVKKQITQRDFYFNTLAMGSGEALLKAIQTKLATEYTSPYKIQGYISHEANSSSLPYLGKISDLQNITEEQNIDQVIIATDNEEEQTNIIATILGKNIDIQLLPTQNDVIKGAVQSTNIQDSPFISISHVAMSEAQLHIKRLFDIVLAIVSTIILLPLIVFVWLRTKLSNGKKALYVQERLGKNEKPFLLYKFQSMIDNAEPNGPQLSSQYDERITKWGKVMRKWRLDELPQLWNILKGDMSFVGPRPERQFFAQQLIEKNPYYKILYEMKPGLTSWGMVKYGYAENIDQMLERIQYDFVYVRNASLLLDIKILLHTIRVILLGKGK